MSRSKVKGQGHRVTRNNNALCTHNTPAVWTEWNALVADNVAQAADEATRSLQRGVFAGMRALGLRATAGLCHAFLVFFVFGLKAYRPCIFHCLAAHLA